MTANPMDRNRISPAPSQQINTVQNPVQQTAAEARNTSHGDNAIQDLRAHAPRNDAPRNKQYPRQESNL